MKKLVIKNAHIFDSENKKFFFGEIESDERGIISRIERYSNGKSALFCGSCDEIIDADGRYLIPGFVDIHTHGRSGADFAGADTDTLLMMKHAYQKTGVTTVVPTLASETFDVWLSSTNNIASCGFDAIHYEGRYLNKSKRGAHAAELLKEPDISEFDTLVGLCRDMKIRFTMAPELPNGEEFIRHATKNGVCVSLGHSAATYEQAIASASWGVSAFTHTYNAMSPLHHRDPGAVGAALLSGLFAEFICDGFHIHPAAVKLAYNVIPKDRFVLVTDSLMAAGCEDGKYTLAGLEVNVTGGKAYTVEGAIAGSTLDMFTAVKNLVSFADISFEDALICATKNPVSMIGLDSVTGSLRTGLRADMILLDAEKEKIEKVVSKGMIVS